jgi:hypothetical protein
MVHCLPKCGELTVTVPGKVSALKQLVIEQRAEIARLKDLTGPTDIKSSGMDKGTEPAKPDRQKNRPDVARSAPASTLRIVC